MQQSGSMKDGDPGRISPECSEAFAENWQNTDMEALKVRLSADLSYDYREDHEGTAESLQEYQGQILP